MEITLDKLLEGKATIIKDREFKATKEYVQPFIDEINKYAEKLIIQVQQPDQIIITDNKVTTYNKVWIQGLLPNVINNKQETINFVYSLDNRVPVYKVLASACVSPKLELLSDDCSPSGTSGNIDRNSIGLFPSR